MKTRIIKHGGEMCYGSDRGMHTSLSEILVPDDGFGDCFSLRLWRIELFQEVEGKHASKELEGELRA